MHPYFLGTCIRIIRQGAVFFKLITLYHFFFASEEKEMVAVEVERMLRLAEQCLERAKSFIEKRSDHPDRPTSPCSTGESEPLQTTVHPSATAGNTSELNPLRSEATSLYAHQSLPA